MIGRDTVASLRKQQQSPFERHCARYTPHDDDVIARFMQRFARALKDSGHARQQRSTIPAALPPDACELFGHCLTEMPRQCDLVLGQHVDCKMWRNLKKGKSRRFLVSRPQDQRWIERYRRKRIDRHADQGFPCPAGYNRYAGRKLAETLSELP